ncbi:tRNA (34-2'-O)-methyltransferase regulator WDR6 [Nothobranchius furzeri]|uniref:tRNA (34-2'-O)-methyltransferase regulator WDR6 n=1 Tax=Nothobranchius furzeri TaxID=105023 RepID=A0A1A8UI43_NOTFU|nr:WD repeat-containing protein 6 [Nothobranchius furzeri]KAF7209432.1 WD repeat domain 6 [Nothobranchius furzeri]
METVALVAPITALEFLQDKFLLTGEGPVLSVYSLQPHPKARASLSVLLHHRIHGIRPRSPETLSQKEHVKSSATELNFYDVLVFGGKAVRLVRLHVDSQDVEHLHLEILGALLELQDWALDARWLSGGEQSLLCVAVAHNGALLLDVHTGSTLVECFCLEGCLLYSALLLVHESWVDTVLVGGTVFNQLVIWKPGGCHEMKDSGFKAPVERHLLGHSGVIFSISYLRENGYLASASDDRSVRIWDVGALGGPGGKCGVLDPTCLRVLYGHQARVFSVCLSPGRVFSAGEDGACLVWNLAGSGNVVRTLKGHRAGGVRALAISVGAADKKWVATGGADGGLRLWRVEDGEQATTEKLTDLKLPDHGLPKVVCIAGGGNENTSGSQFVTCTDRGIVCQYSDGKWETLWQGSPEFGSYCVMDTVTADVKDSASTFSLCAVGNLSGSLKVFPTSQPQSGVCLSAGLGKIHSVIWQKERNDVYLLASGNEGLVYRWKIEIGVKVTCSLTLKLTPLPPFLLPRCSKRWITAAVRLHACSERAIWVCGDRRGSLLLYDEDLLRNRKLGEDEQAGELSGEIEAEESQELHELQPLSCLVGVHGKQGVTSVCEYRGLLYSTGKDGCVRISRVNQTSPMDPKGSRGSEVSNEDEGRFQLEVLRVQRACKGMEWLERVLFLQSEVPVKEEEEDSESEGEQSLLEARFVIAGFHANHFVVWDPLRQERLMAVPCGGGHRSWSIWPAHTRIWPGYGALVFIKQGAILTSQPPEEMLGWEGKEERSEGWSLREGIHGRGIWCVCRLGRIEFGKGDTNKAEREKRHWEIVVTGGEDTSLAVLAVDPDSGMVKLLSVITDHISGVRTLAAIKRPEGGSEKSLSALLLSAGGRAQIQCYRLLITWPRKRPAPSCQVIQVGGHRLDTEWEKRRNRHKTVKMDPETRYLSMEIVEENSGCVLLVLSCSDGAVRLFAVCEGKNQIDLLWETFHHQRCVLSVATCSLEDEKGNRCKLLFSAATDGKIAVWHLTEAHFLSIDNSSGAPTPPIPCLDIPAHQSGINSLVVWVEKRGRQEGGCLVTVASGGDDGQLTVSMIRVQYPEDWKTSGNRGSLQISNADMFPQTKVWSPNQIRVHLHSQSHVPLAHAAPLTALKLLSPGCLVSTSSDQRVCLWRVSGTSITHRGALCSHVADTADLAVWEEEEGKCEEKPDPVWENSDGKCFETSGDQTGNDAGGKTGSKSSCESCKKGQRVGWVLACGQGFQLLKIETTVMEAEVCEEKLSS